jgi:hypothetical protein
VKRIHLVRWSGPPDRLGPLIAAARAVGLRVGWLETGAADPVPPGAEAASGAGVFRSVAISAGRSVSVKRLGGPPVLRDVLREHFLGCSLVVVGVVGVVGLVGDDGPFGAELESEPALEAVEGGYRVMLAGGAGRDFTPERLAERLRRPRPWS